jgi:hypothetical protein
MRFLLALALLAVASFQAAAADRGELIEALGALSIAPQLCALPVDRERLAAYGKKLLPEEAGLQVAIFSVNDRIAAEQRGWSPAERKTFCDAAAEGAARAGLLAR